MRISPDRKNKVQSPKVFGIGFHKTGTTSLGLALRELGYTVCGAVGVHDPAIRDRLEYITLPHVERFDAFEDNPWPLLYRVLDSRYPGSRFVLTLRPTDSWIRSIVQHFGGTSTPMRELIYGPGRGDPRGNERRYVEVYEAHNHEVVEYFRGRSQDLLVLRMTEGDGWDRLCRFLGRPAPSIPFPTANSARQRRWRGVRRVVGRMLGPPSLPR